MFCLCDVSVFVRVAVCMCVFVCFVVSCGLCVFSVFLRLLECVWCVSCPCYGVFVFIFACIVCLVGIQSMYLCGPYLSYVSVCFDCVSISCPGMSCVPLVCVCVLRLFVPGCHFVFVAIRLSERVCMLC